LFLPFFPDEAMVVDCTFSQSWIIQ
jgi:hypothetical protein